MSLTATNPMHERRGWRPLELAAMIAGFVLFWPVGLAILAWKGWKEGWWVSRSALAGVFQSNRWGDKSNWRGERRWTGPGWTGPGWDNRELNRDSGNAAFEDYKAAELKRLQAEFERLVAEQKAFGEFLDNLRRAKDKAEFDQFVASRRATDGPVAPAAA